LENNKRVYLYVIICEFMRVSSSLWNSYSKYNISPFTR